MQEYFPLGMVSGEFFCNRVQEREQLKNNINKGQHTILASPRRYGKTSLAFQVFADLSQNLISSNVDFLIAPDIQYIQNAILSCVGAAIPKILPHHKNITEKIKKFFSFSNTKLILSASGPSIEFTHSQPPQETIVEALIGLDKIAQEENKRVALLFDEFQQIGVIKHCESVEAAIRHAAERTKRVSYIFSGSDRHLLTKMFEDSARPLYHLCIKMPLNRIAAEEYNQHLQKLSRMRWQKKLDDEIISAILTCTKCHPYYVNLLCSQIWENANPIQDKTKVVELWDKYVQSEQSRIAYELARLSPNQRAVIRALATEHINQPGSQYFLEKVRLPTTSASQAIEALTAKDIIYKDQDGYLAVLDPAVGYFIAQFLSN